MVETIFAGESGNNLFQYFLGFCISHEKKYGISFKTHNRGNTFKSQKEFFIFNGLKLPSHVKGTIINNNIMEFNDHRFDWEKSLNHNGKIKLFGFFQKYEYFKPYKTLIKETILKYNNIFDYHDKPKENDLVLHFRDYKGVKNIPVSYYEKLIENGSYDTIWLVSRYLNNDMKSLLKKYKNAKLKMGGSENDFLFICNANNIGVSQSTFSWWASFISKSKYIFLPIGKDNSYLWHENPQKNRMNLFVDDENRYKKIIV